ncbi:hypothetical protein [Streptomyces sp. NPDC059063]|uniref:hypothetical protein n=1 Tax=unclassified Streptomyces TaxID=2593676 RepID=UPI0036AE965D
MQEVITTVGPVGGEEPDLGELRKPGVMEQLRASQRAQSAEGLLPRETVGPARDSGLRAATDSATPSLPKRPVSATAIQLPEPPHTMTRKQCKDGLGNKVFYVRSRFAVCSGKKFNQVWLRSGRPIGWSSFKVLTVGTIPKNSRTMTVTYHLTDFRSSGTHNATGMGIHIKAKIAKSWPARAQYKYGGARMPVRKSWGMSSFKHTVWTAPDQVSVNDGVFGAYEAKVSMSAPPGWALEVPNGGSLFMLPPRWDKAAYLPNRANGAAVFSVSTALEYSTSASAPEKDVAKHIKLAFTNPGRTHPPYSGKRLPGRSADEPLTRLYKDGTRRKENYNKSRYNCKKWFGDDYAEGGKKECDEFPFQTTYEGAAASKYDHRVHPKNFSVKALPKKSNGAAGILLAQYYDKNRLIDGPDDGFLVKITS